MGSEFAGDNHFSRLNQTLGTGRAEQRGPGQAGVELGRGGRVTGVSGCSEVSHAVT